MSKPIPSRSHRWLALALIAVTACAEAESRTDAPHRSATEELEEPQRRYVELGGDPVALFGRPPYGLGIPTMLAVAPNGDVLVADFAEPLVRRYRRDGTWIRDYGRGRGQGPGEFGSITDLGLDRQGRLWTLDTVLGRIQVFDQASDSVATIPVRVPAIRMAVLPMDRAILLTMSDLLFLPIDADGATEQPFGRVVDDQRRLGIALQGMIAQERGIVLYTGVYYGSLIAYSTDGRHLYTRPTMTPHPIPPVEARADGFIQISPDHQRVAATSMATAEGRAYVLARDDGRSVVDVYQTDSGDYLYSFESPDRRAQFIGVGDGRILLAGDTLVQAWNLPQTQVP